MGTTAALVDDHSIFREGLKLLFDLHGDPRVVGEASTSRDAVEMVSNTHPDVVVLDMVFPNDASGIALAHRLLKCNPSLRILFLSMVKDETQVADALEAGALGYVTKDQSVQELMDAVRTVAAGRPYLSRTLRIDRIEERRRYLRATSGSAGQLASLSMREREIFDLTVAGLTAKAVGEKLGISARTVETHRSRIQRKLGAHSVSDLVRIAARAGVLA
ncbi:MAG TPA: response regulator transcription factor [Myxococcales bacterium]|nr:response regulator transcription factor [Myxococcales bacterium]